MAVTDGLGSHLRGALALVLGIACTSVGAAPWTVEGRVVGVSDGDTVTVLDDAKKQHKVRLAGIDAPEKGQAFGNASKENLSRLIFDRRIEARCNKRDRYGRDVCAVFLGSRDVALEQVRAGMAWHFKRFQNEQAPAERAEFAEAEERARAARRGLWADKNPVPPWDSRGSRASK